MNSISARLQQARINRRLSIYQAARKIPDCTPDKLRAWEIEDSALEPTIRQLQSITDLYRITFKWLVDGVDSDNGHNPKQKPVAPLKTQYRLNTAQRTYLAALHWGGHTNEREIEVMDYLILVDWGMVLNDGITAFGTRYAELHLEVR